MFIRLLIFVSITELIDLTSGCLPTSTSQIPAAALVGHPGDPGYPGPPGSLILRGKREIDVSQDLLYFMTQETNFKAAEKLVENEREALLSKLKSSKSVYDTISKDLQKPLIFGSDGGYISSVMNLESLQEWKMCYYFAEKVMLLNNEDSTKGIKMVVTCNGEQFY